MRPPIRPSEGEQRSISGYYGHYHVAATVILKGRREEGLEWVRVRQGAYMTSADIEL